MKKPYSTGDRIKMQGGVYLLAQVDNSKVAAICLADDGNRWRNPLVVGDIHNLTGDELIQITGNPAPPRTRARK